MLLTFLKNMINYMYKSIKYALYLFSQKGSKDI